MSGVMILGWILMSVNASLACSLLHSSQLTSDYISLTVKIVNDIFLTAKFAISDLAILKNISGFLFLSTTLAVPTLDKA